MSDRLQFDFHPDADQISAFVEHALPAHEREQMLDHLAVCPECRTVVALSLPAVEEPAQPMPAAPRKPWWSGWAVVWPTAAALAAIVFLVVYFHRSAIAPNASAPTEMAGAYAPAPPNAQGQPPTSVVPQTLRGSQASQAVNSRAPSATGAALAAKQNHGEVVSSQSIAGLAMQGRNVGPSSDMAQATPAPLPASAGQSAVAGTGSSGALGKGVGGAIAMAPNAVAKARLQSPASAAPEPATIAAAQPARFAAAPTPSTQTTATVSVTNAAPMPTVSADVSNIAISENEVQGTLLKHALPSRLPVLSMAVQERFIVAIDTGNAVFLSKDGGKHWRTVGAPWPGRAVKAELAAYPARGLTGDARDKSAGVSGMAADCGLSAGGANGAVVAQGRSLKELPGSSVSGNVTDPGGAVIAGASVSVTDNATHAVRTATADANGRYRVDGLAPGTYQLEVQAPGFNRQVLAAVAVSVSRPTVQNLSLSVGAVSESVMVEAESAAVSLSKKTKAKSVAANQAAALFEITTDNGERWTSRDGVNWTHK